MRGARFRADRSGTNCSSAIVEPFSFAKRQCQTPSISNIAPFSPTAMPTPLWRNGCMRALRLPSARAFGPRDRARPGSEAAPPHLPRPRRLQRGRFAERSIHRRARRFRRFDGAVLARLGEKPLRERGNPALQASPPGPAGCAGDPCGQARWRRAGMLSARAAIRAGC